MLFDGQVVADGSPREVLANEDQLRGWRVLPTSLLRMNQQYFPQTGRFLRAEALSQFASV